MAALSLFDEIPSHSPARRLIEGAGTEDARWRDSAEMRNLPTCDVEHWASRFRRIWLVAPHPDDEILALGGSLAQLSTSGADLCILSVTDGEASHPGSRRWTPSLLASARREETANGLATLHIDTMMQRFGLPDGKVTDHRATLLRMLVDLVEEQDLILTTCRFDGHPDHEACGDVSFLAADVVGATVYEYPVWMWHWAAPGATMVPWSRAQRIPIDDATVARKADAIQAFTSQVERDGLREAVLPPHVISRFLRPFEVVFT